MGLGAAATAASDNMKIGKRTWRIGFSADLARPLFPADVKAHQLFLPLHVQLPVVNQGRRPVLISVDDVFHLADLLVSLRRRLEQRKHPLVGEGDQLVAEADERAAKSE